MAAEAAKIRAGPAAVVAAAGGAKTGEKAGAAAKGKGGAKPGEKAGAAAKGKGGAKTGEKAGAAAKGGATTGEKAGAAAGRAPPPPRAGADSSPAALLRAGFNSITTPRKYEVYLYDNPEGSDLPLISRQVAVEAPLPPDVLTPRNRYMVLRTDDDGNGDDGDEDEAA